MSTPEENYIIPDSPIYDPQLRKLQCTDPADADTIFNPLISQMINNTHALSVSKADKSTTYTKAEVNEALDNRAVVISAFSVFQSNIDNVDYYIAEAPELKEYTDKMLLLLNFDKSNINGVAVNINSLGNIPLMKISNTGETIQLVNGDLNINVKYFFQYVDGELIFLSDNSVNQVYLTKQKFESLPVKDINTTYYIVDDEEDYGELAVEVNEHIENSSIHTEALTANMNIHVSTTGSDETGDGTLANPYKSITFGASKRPKLQNGHVVYLRVADGIYDEDVVINGYGTGLVYVAGSVDVIVKSIKVISVEKLLWFGATVTNFMSYGVQMYLQECNRVSLWQLNLVANDKIKGGLFVTQSGKIQLYASEISNKQIAIQAHESDLYVCSISGTNNNIGYAVGSRDMATGGIIQIGYGCTLTANILTQEQFGGRIFSPENAIEQGTWTPRLFPTTGTITTKYTVESATYSKVGKDVTLWWNIHISDIGVASDGADIIGISDLPYVVGNQSPVGSYINPISYYYGLYGQKLNTICYPLSTNTVLKFGNLAIGTYVFELKYQTI